MSSFYGGKQGRTYNIVQRYDCVYLIPNNYPNRPQELQIGDIYKDGERVYCYLGKDENQQDKIYELKGMVNQFQKGGAYTEANYGEYVLIDTSLTTGKSNRENGLLYRRGFNFLEEPEDRPKQNDAAYQKTVDNVTEFDQKKYQAAWINWARNPGGGAIYEGQIVGPEGKVPNVTVENWDAFLQQIDEGQGGYSAISMNSSGIVENEEGAETPYSYNDEIDVGYVNLMDATGDVVGAYLAFDIPTPVFNITAQSVDPYGQETLYKSNIEGTASSTYQINSTYDSENHKWKYDGLVYKQPESAEHSFFHNFDIAIPNGIHGQNIESIEIETAEDGTDFSNANYNDVIDGDQYFTYTSKNYDQSAEGAETEHLGRWPYRVINEITALSSTRTSSIEQWTQGSSVVLGDIYKILERQNQNDLYILCIRAGEIGQEESIPEDIVEGVQFQSGSSKWIALTLEEATAASQLIVDYTAGNNDQFNYKQIDHMFIDDVGRLYAVFSTDLETPICLGAIKQIDSITLDPDIRNPQIIKANYLAGSTTHISQDIGTLNNILDIQRVGDSIVVLYSDPAVRAAIPQANRYYMPWEKQYYYEQRAYGNIQGNINSLIRNGLLFVYDQGQYIQIEQGIHDLSWVSNNISDWRDKLYQKIYTYDNLIWYNFGPLGTQYHVQGSYTFDDIDYYGTSPIRNGLGDEESGTQNRQGWLITIQDQHPQQGQQGEPDYIPAKEVQRVFAYDYARFARGDEPYTITTFSTPASTYNSYWHEIISLTDSVTPADSHIVVSQNIDSATSDDSIYQSRDNLKENGIWFEVTGGGCSHG